MLKQREILQIKICLFLDLYMKIEHTQIMAIINGTSDVIFKIKSEIGELLKKS